MPSLASVDCLPPSSHIICLKFAGKKGQQVWTEGDDAEALSRGVYNTYTSRNLRYSQVIYKVYNIYTSRNLRYSQVIYKVYNTCTIRNLRYSQVTYKVYNTYTGRNLQYSQVIYKVYNRYLHW